jgi:predicted small integral membrane protein
MAGDATNNTLVFELTDSNTSKGAVDTETVNKDRLRDELVGRDFLEDTFVGLLVEDNHVVGLILDLLSRPLLLGLLASR